MVRKILIGLGAVIALFLIFVATRSSDFHLERSTTIAAPPEAVYAQINDFHQWSNWSPWDKLDPAMKRTYEGPASGVGASYAWVGNDKVGEGRMTIEKSETPSVVGVKLEFIKPWTATNVTTFTMTPTAEGTKVTWAMDGKNNFMAKAAHIFMDMDKLVGKDFESGLAAMKASAESASKAEPEAKKAPEGK